MSDKCQMSGCTSGAAAAYGFYLDSTVDNDVEPSFVQHCASCTAVNISTMALTRVEIDTLHLL